MPLRNLITSQASIDSFRATRAGFGKPMILSPNVTFEERARTVSSRTALLALAGLTTSSPEVAAFDAMFGQERRPANVSIGRRATAVAQVHAYTVGSTTNGSWTIAINGEEFTFVASSSTTTQIRDGLNALINDAEVTEPVTAAAVSTAQGTLTADNAGQAFSVVLTGPVGSTFTGSQSTANVGPVEDLAAIKAYDPTWYGFIELSRTPSNILECARYAATTDDDGPVLFVAQSNDAAILDAEDDTDVFSQLLALSRNRTVPLYKSSDAQYYDAALLGRQLPTVPGTTNWAWQPIAGVTADDLTYEEVEAIRGKQGGWIENIGGQVLGFEGRVAQTDRWVDQTRGRDKVKNDIDMALVDFFAGAERVGFDEVDAVVAIVDAAIKGNSGFVVKSTVQTLAPDEITEAQISDRSLVGITWSATMRTPINKANNVGILTIGGIV